MRLKPAQRNGELRYDIVKKVLKIEEKSEQRSGNVNGGAERLPCPSRLPRGTTFWTSFHAVFLREKKAVLEWCDVSGGLFVFSAMTSLS